MRDQTRDRHAELLRHVAEISSILDQLDGAVEVFVERHGELSHAVAAAQACRSAVFDLKREMLRQYLDYRIATAEASAASMMQ
jgi:hypothetical protein